MSEPQNYGDTPKDKPIKKTKLRVSIVYLNLSDVLTPRTVLVSTRLRRSFVTRERRDACRLELPASTLERQWLLGSASLGVYCCGTALIRIEGSCASMAMVLRSCIWGIW
eukprot:371551-Amphidinium_carterae.1